MPRRVVTLPPSSRGEAAVAFAARARRLGADLLEVRTDLHGADDVPVRGVADRIPLLIAERGRRVPEAWQTSVALVDGEDGGLVSEHFAEALRPSDAVGWWSGRAVRDGALIKHVEPLGAPAEAGRLFETQRLLAERFGRERVTVLATGPLALPFRAALAERNALDFCAVDLDWSAAVGQRLLEDAVRAGGGRRDSGAERAVSDSVADNVANGARLGIIGSRIGASRSPRIHPQPFDRIDLPEDADVGAMIDALLPHYRGLAITAPFKRAVARHLGAPLEAVNTLVRRSGRWFAANTDVEGARAVIQALNGRRGRALVPERAITALGSGGATVALRAVCPDLQTITRAEISDAVSGTFIWTWPAHLEPPMALRFQPGTRVAVIAYGPPARRIAAEIRARGGMPLLLGPSWFVAQARAQQALWRTAS